MVEVRLKLRGIRAVLKSAPVQAEVARRARRMAAEAGEGFEAVVKPHRHTSRAFVQTDAENPRGRQRQATEHVLQRVIG